MNQFTSAANAQFRPRRAGDRAVTVNSDDLAARIEPFDSFWQAPEDVEKGYGRFAAYYRTNYLPRLPVDRESRILVVSCGPGYLVKTLVDAGYRNVVGIDSFPDKVEFARQKGLDCRVARAFEFLAESDGAWDCIIPEQELNHLTTSEQIDFLALCRQKLRPGGTILVYGLNGANPFVGAENLAHNIDHFNLLTEYSLWQVLDLCGFENVSVFPLKVYVFWKNPGNYVGLALTTIIELTSRLIFTLYGKNVTVLSKKLAATARRAA
jgi:2-polyprenyl-3-methyl-5-hydroxy-6-metoxy-1,4-benzoquinol methylase